MTEAQQGSNFNEKQVDDDSEEEEGGNDEDVEQETATASSAAGIKPVSFQSATSNHFHSSLNSHPNPGPASLESLLEEDLNNDFAPEPLSPIRSQEQTGNGHHALSLTTTYTSLAASTLLPVQQNSNQVEYSLQSVPVAPSSLLYSSSNNQRKSSIRGTGFLF